MAQAHAAWLTDGTAVVIKVLHDGVEQSVDIDLNALKSIMLAARFVKRSKEEIDLIFSEIRERLLEELDYEKEAQNLVYFHEAFQDIPGLSAPKPYLPLCTRRILVMDRMLGMTLVDFLEQATVKAKALAAETLAIAFHEMVYVHRSLSMPIHTVEITFSNSMEVFPLLILDASKILIQSLFMIMGRWHRHWSEKIKTTCYDTVVS